MVRIYVKEKCLRVSECIRWFQNNGVEYEVIDLDEEHFTFTDFKLALSLLTSTDDIIAKRSLDYKRMKNTLGDEMTLSALYKYAIESKSMLKNPIVMGNSNKIMVGFKEDEATTFLPRGKRGLSSTVEVLTEQNV